jgi:hypothetical protein
MRADNSLEKARAERGYRVAFTSIIVGWFSLNLALSLLFAYDISNKLIYALFLLPNAFFACGFYYWWTDATHKRVREDLRRRHHLHALSDAKDSRHSPDDLRA